MNATPRLPVLALLVTTILWALPGNAEESATTDKPQRPDAAQTAVDKAADAAEEAANKAVESLNQETKLDLDFTLDNHQNLRVATRIGR